VNIRKNIPNALTCCNLIAGCCACWLAFNGNCYGALAAVLTAGLFDFADGLAARWLNACSSIGKDLDSLSDIVSFGLAPAIMIYRFIDGLQQSVEWSYPLAGQLFALSALVVPVCSALRLAKFNNDERQAVSFIGLPVPAHAFLWTSLVCWLTMSGYALPAVPTLAAVAVCVVATSLLMVSEVPMFSLKIKSLVWKGNEKRYILLCLSVVFILFFRVLGIALTIVSYILLAIINKKNKSE